MGELLADLVSWLTALPPFWAYALILAIAYGENVIPPIPGDMIVVFGGYMAGLGRLDFTLVVLVATLGGTAGFMTMYAIGAKVGDALMDPGRLKWLPKGKIERARRYLTRWRFGLVAANRFLSGLRSVISLSVGMARLPAWWTAFWSTASSLLWTGLLAWAGWAIGDNWEVVAVYLERYGWAIMGLLVLFFGGQFVYYMRRRQPEPAESTPD